MVLLLSVGALTVTSATAQVETQDDASPGADGPVVTVLARNLYLGADVGLALELLPDLGAAAQSMWEQVAATDIDARVPSLAAEVARHEPHVIGLQEATTWRCRPGRIGRSQVVYDFTETFLEATRDAGVGYVIAELDGHRAENVGYSIPILPVSTVEDPDTFQPLFGRDTATCGFAIGDALLIREDLVGGLRAVGTSEFRDRYSVVPVVMPIDRGYAWADLRIEGSTARFVTTHLESLWDPGEEPHSSRQARQLIDDLDQTQLPTIIVGDLNADPRDPRGADDANPAGQPQASEACDPQVDDPTALTADASCNAYWQLRQAGFEDAGPDVDDPEHFTWGTNALLAGPDPTRLEAALQRGNPWGFTDRLDHVLVRDVAEVVDALIIGNRWPDGEDVWDCDHPDQIADTAAATRRLEEAGASGEGEVIRDGGVCLPTDHAGVVSQIRLTLNDADASSPRLPEHARTPGWFWPLVGLLLLTLLLEARRIRRRS
ncbi:endonuclease/exonuclease/phosphatase family protein [Nitriliruptor alkaliphilus]|uniref:endonuclease/exonuclease/phosphatase family protein n=1 Tax=Nitriliruptor alkaliphilus TaxID=427918 RepID=UPI000696A2A0|nr:endonuclease/exonuclease/phosphatase family protein [Nitriliruptor alkaliphilus]